MEEKIIEDEVYEFTPNGVVVKIGRGITLPGVFLNAFDAERAYDKHCALKRRMVVERRKVNPNYIKKKEN